MAHSEEVDNMSRTSSSTSLREIDQDLQEVEQGLMTSRRPRGRAFFDSVNTMLSSVRNRIEHHQPNSVLNALSSRLDDAQMAHSNRVPLDLLRSARSLRTLQDRRDSRSSHLKQVNSQKDMSSDQGSSMDIEERKSSTSQQVHGKMHRSCSLVASRSQAEALSNSDMDLHEALPTLGSVGTGGKDEGTEMEIDEEEVKASNEALKLPETPILLSRLSQRRASSFSRSISGSITPSRLEKEEESSSLAVYSWGPASYSSLHDDDQARSADASVLSAKSRIGRLSGITSVSCSPTHSACVSNSGEVLTCGDNSSGAVDPSRPFKHEVLRPSKLELFGTTEICQVSCGFDHAAALTSLGAVLTWGSDDRDQLGHFRAAPDSPTKFVRPMALFLGAGVRGAAVACGNKFTMVLTTRMSVLICGDPVIAGYKPGIDSDEKSSRRLPGQLSALVGLPLVAVAAGKDHAVVLTAHGTAYAWGSNKSGCCGRPYPKELSPVPVVVPLDELESSKDSTPFPGWTTSASSLVSIADNIAVVHAACGHDHTVLVTRSGRLLVCGANGEGQIGIPIKSEVLQVEPLEHPEPGRRFVSAEAGNMSTMLLDDVGDVWLMGSSVPGSSMKRVLSGKNILVIAAGGTQCVAVAVTGATHRQFSMASIERQVSSCGSTLARDVEGLIRSVAEETEDDEHVSLEGQELVKRTEELLKHPSVLNSLFLDPSELEDLYEEIQDVGGVKLRQNLALATEKSILAGLGSLQSEGARLIYPEAVRFLLHYIKFFDRDENEASFDVHGSCIVSFCETLLNLPYEGFQAFVNWSTLYPRDMFVRVLVRPLLSQLTIALHLDVDDDGVQHPKPSRRAIPGIVAVLRWLHRASERAEIAKPEDFYCDGVNKVPLEILYEDLRALKNLKEEERARSFLICASPFLIPPAKKRDLLQIESQVSMIKIATEDARYDQNEGVMEVDPFYVLEIERESLLEQTLANIKKASQKELRKKLRVKFKGEDGIDAGGVTKEFFQLVSEELFDISSGMWTRRFGEDVTWFNSDCTWDDEGYELAGVLVGLALYNGVVIDVRFPPAVYRKLLNLSLGLEDVVDPELRKGLRQLLDYEGDDVEDIFCLTFEVSWMDLGKEQLVELKTDGANIPVTSSNKEEYVLLYVKWLLVDSVYSQWEAFKMGLMRIMESASLDLFTPEEMELLLTGSQDLDFAALEANTEYEGGFTKDSEVVKNLWKFVRNADHETQMMFMKFTTGTSKAPIGGLKELPFKIQRAGPDSPQLPTSHTCFNTLLLPDYGDSYEKLAERLGRAVLECEGFGLE